MKRWLWFGMCAVLGLVMLVCGLLVPAHLRAVDARVIEQAGRKSRTLVEEGFALVNQKQLGPAQQFLLAAKAENLAGYEKLELMVGHFAKANPRLLAWGGPDFYLDTLFPDNAGAPPSGSLPFITFVVPLEHRQKVLQFLDTSGSAEARQIARCRSLTNTTLFPSAASASGQAWEATLALTGLLLHERRLKPGLHDSLTAMAAAANRGGNTERFEQMLMDLMSLGQRLNWLQLVAFVGQIEDAETLRQLAYLARKTESASQIFPERGLPSASTLTGRSGSGMNSALLPSKTPPREEAEMRTKTDVALPVLFSAVYFSGNPAGVAKYLMTFDQSGRKDLATSLHFGAGGLKELLQRRRPICNSHLRNSVVQYDPFGAFFYVMLDYCWLTPWVAFSFKWFFYLAGGFLLAMALHFARPTVSVLEQPLQVRGFHLAREFLFALGFLLVILLLSEPFLAQESQKVDIPFRLRLPTVGSAVPPGLTHASASFMNQLVLLTLLLFFVLQALIYSACLVKLAEIRRQNIAPRIKLKLLENEDHLFDAGLYLGFVGTIISLILVSVGVIKPSLMAAYSSTSFGIIFVSIFKIFHLRPLRRKLLLETEAIPS